MSILYFKVSDKKTNGSIKSESNGHVANGKAVKNGHAETKKLK